MSQEQKSTSFIGLDIFKLVVAVILIIILILLLLRGCGAAGGLAGQPTAPSPLTEAAAPEETEAAEATQEAAPTPTVAPTEEPTPSPAGPTAPVITAPADGAEVPAGALTIEGMGAPGTELEIVQDGAVVGTTTVGADGRWSASITPEPGEHVFTARPTGNEALTSAPVRVTVREETVGCDYHTLGSGYMPDAHHYVVGPCDTLSGIAAWLGVTVEALMAANPQITDPNLIYPGMVINVP